MRASKSTALTCTLAPTAKVVCFHRRDQEVWPAHHGEIPGRGAGDGERQRPAALHAEADQLANRQASRRVVETDCGSRLNYDVWKIDVIPSDGFVIEEVDWSIDRARSEVLRKPLHMIAQPLQVG